MAVPTFQFNEAERRRTIDFAMRLRTVRYPAMAFLLPATVLALTTYGLKIVPFVLAIIVAFGVLGFTMFRSKRPELALVAVLVAAQAGLVGMIAVGEVYRLDALCMLILPAAGACVLFPRPLMMAFTLWSVAVIIGAAFAIDPQRVIEEPSILILPIGVMLCVALPGAMIRQLDIESRDTAQIDPLTGVLNRGAFETRIAELTAQSRQLPIRVGVIMADLDRFKLVNDELGHEAGDAVLQETARRLRAVLGPMTPVYRVGGEEFAILMPGVNEVLVEETAERLRQAIRDVSMHDRVVTMSFGIAAGPVAEYPVAHVIKLADEALYRAKRSGRDRVTAAEIAELPASGDERAPSAESTGAARPSASRGGAHGSASSIAHGGTAKVSLGHDNGNWLVRGEFERDHMRTSARALARTHHGALGFVGLALLLSIPWMGWHLMVPAIPAVIFYHAAERRIRKLRHPEYVLGAAWLSVQVAILAGAVIADPGEPYMLVLFIPMLIGMTATFPSRGVVLNSGITVSLVILAAVLARPDILQVHPGVIAPPIVVLVGIALISSVTGRSAIEFRTKAIVDPLTGLLSRRALQSRLAEIGHESPTGTAPVSVIVFDIDHFKDLNDTHGHALGDAVLRAVGHATRTTLDTLAWGFRTGGDEFMVVGPGGAEEAARLAERLRGAIDAIEIDGVHVTGSFGVAAHVGGRLDVEDLSRRADAALYEAKRAGRNRVAVAPLADAPTAAAPRAVPAAPGLSAA